SSPPEIGVECAPRRPFRTRWANGVRGCIAGGVMPRAGKGSVAGVGARLGRRRARCHAGIVQAAEGSAAMAKPTYDFNSRVAVVTGAGGGMGEAIALALAEAGAKVTAIDMKGCPDTLKTQTNVTFAQGDLRDEGF